MAVTLQEIDAEFQAMRGLTLDLLNACSEADLASALPQCGPVWKQFRHIAGVHEDYLSAIETGQINFDGSCRSYGGDDSRSALQAYFHALSERHGRVLSQASTSREIDWFDERISLGAHLMRLISHETLHHGQLILLWRTRSVQMPSSWQMWGV